MKILLLTTAHVLFKQLDMASQDEVTVAKDFDLLFEARNFDGLGRKEAGGRQEKRKGEFHAHTISQLVCSLVSKDVPTDAL